VGCSEQVPQRILDDLAGVQTPLDERLEAGREWGPEDCGVVSRVVVLLPQPPSHGVLHPITAEPDRPLLSRIAASAPVRVQAWCCDEARGNGVEVDVAHEFLTVFEVVDGLRDEASAKERTVAPSGAVEPPRVLAVDLAHRGRELAGRAADEEVVVRREHAEGVQLELSGTDPQREP
jgi:hypothetical protein